MILFFVNTVLSIVMLAINKDLSPSAYNLLLLLLFTDIFDVTCFVPFILGCFVLSKANKSAWAELMEANSGITRAMYIIFMIQFVIGAVVCGIVGIVVVGMVVYIIIDVIRAARSVKSVKSQIGHGIAVY